MTNPYTKTRVRKIIRRFGMNMLSLKMRSSFYRKNAVIQVQTENGVYALKPFFRNTYLRSSTVQQIKTAMNVARFLMDNGYNYMPNWLSTKSNALWTIDQGRPFYITEWIKGRNLEGAEDFEELGRALATLHTLSYDIHTTKKSYTLKRIRIWKFQDRLFRKRMAKVIQNKERHRGWYKKYGKAFKRQVDRAWTDLEEPAIVTLLKMEPPALIHSDITTPNVIISDDGRLYIIDWDCVKVGSIYVDISKALRNTTQFNPEFIQSLLKGYEELKPLHQSERRVITSLYGIPQEAWYVARCPKTPRSMKMMDMIDQTWHQRLKALDLLDEWTNQ